jgi:hypothetical protein
MLTYRTYYRTYCRRQYREVGRDGIGTVLEKRDGGTQKDPYKDPNPNPNPYKDPP